MPIRWCAGRPPFGDQIPDVVWFGEDVLELVQLDEDALKAVAVARQACSFAIRGHSQEFNVCPSGGDQAVR